jgi:hypothetical protein
MRTAICLFGIVGGKDGRGGKGGNIPFKECYDTYKKHIIDINKADVFIHSWSNDVEDEVLSLYKPKKYTFEKNKEFKHTFTHKPESAFRSLSRWYSTRESLKLKNEYEIEHGFKYDCVMLIRFDILFSVDLDFKNYDLNYFHAPHWNTPEGLPGRPHIKADRVNRSTERDGFLDLWFFSKSDTMDKLMNVYDGIKSKKYNVSQHKAPWDCLIDAGYSRKDFSYTLYRHFDFELYRWGIYREMKKEF